MRTLMFTLFALAACGDNHTACPEGATAYKGDVIECQGKIDGVCVADRGPGGDAQCRDRCFSQDPDSACVENAGRVMWATSMVITRVDGTSGSICYCEPAPLEPSRDD